MRNFFNKELLIRLISVLLFVPIVVIPLFYSNYLSVIIYILFSAIIVLEINRIKLKVNNIYIYNLYTFMTIISFFMFLILLITEKVSDEMLLGIIIIIWLFDTFSYIGGKVIGGIKLIPKISPGKTYSGFITGFLMTIILIELLLMISENNYKLSIIYTFFIIIFSFIGDVFVSLLKRYANIKDTGNIMPGHGGLLDRFDSFISVFFMVGILNLII